MKLSQLFSVQVLFALAGIAPSIFILGQPTKATALPVRNLDLVTDGVRVSPTQGSPFIDSGSRYDSLRKLDKLPGGILHNGEKDKESSDDKKKESKDGKETCESGNCGGIFDRFDPRINPADFNKLPGGFRSELPNQLLTSQKPII